MLAYAAPSEAIYFAGWAIIHHLAGRFAPDAAASLVRNAAPEYRNPTLYRPPLVSSIRTSCSVRWVPWAGSSTRANSLPRPRVPGFLTCAMQTDFSDNGFRDSLALLPLALLSAPCAAPAVRVYTGSTLGLMSRAAGSVTKTAHRQPTAQNLLLPRGLIG